MGKINNEKATMLFDSSAEVSIIDITFASKVGYMIDESRTQECVAIGKTHTWRLGARRSRSNCTGHQYIISMYGSADQVGQEAILGMELMVPAGIRLDLVDGTLCLPYEVRICLAGRKPIYRSTIKEINPDD